jgi:hypothetical protein
MTVISVLTVIQTGCGRARLGTSQGAPDLGTARFAAAAAVMVGMHSYNNTVGFVPSGHIPPPPPTLSTMTKDGAITRDTTTTTTTTTVVG